MVRKRDYKAEYSRRIANAERRGLSRSQARGHARAGEKRLGKSSTGDSQKLEAALKALRHTGNRGASAKFFGISPERFRRYLRENVEVTGRGRSLRIADHRVREMMVLSEGEARKRRLRDYDQASINGEHLNAVKTFLRSNDIAFLRPFEGRFVIDVAGRQHSLEVDPNALYRIAVSGDEIFHEIYRLIA